MPVDECRVRRVVRALGAAQGLGVEVEEPTNGSAQTVDLAGNQDDVAAGHCREAERASVERLVVESAQGQAVRNGVGTSRGVPLDVRGFQADGIVAQAHVEVAHGAAALIDTQDVAPECRVARGCRIPQHDVTGDSDSAADVIVQRRREVAVEQPFRCLLHKRPVCLQQGMDAFGKPAGDVVFDEPAVVDGASWSHWVVLRDLPETVATQVDERQLRMMSAARRSETIEQVAEWAVDIVAVPAEAWLTGQNATERQQKQQRLVRRALPSALPDVEVVESVEELVAFHVQPVMSPASR